MSKMQVTFVEATRTGTKARVGISGPPGAGKTKTALILARTLAGPVGKIYVIDTESNSSSKYAGNGAGEFQFASFDFKPEYDYTPENCIVAIEAAEKALGDDPDGVILFDSLSHEWEGTGGALAMVDAATARSKSKNSYNAWNGITAEHRKLFEKINHCKHHFVGCFRSKVEYEKNDKGGYDKIGTKAITRDGADFEFDVFCEMTVEHTLWVSKTRCDAMDGKTVKKPDEKFFMTLKDWLAGAQPLDMAQKVVFEQKPATAPVVEAPKTKEMLVHEGEQYGLNGQLEVFAFLKENGFNKFEASNYPAYVKAFQTRPEVTPEPLAQ